MFDTIKTATSFGHQVHPFKVPGPAKTSKNDRIAGITLFVLGGIATVGLFDLFLLVTAYKKNQKITKLEPNVHPTTEKTQKVAEKTSIKKTNNRVKATLEEAIAAVQKDGMSLKDLDETFKANPEVVNAAVAQNPNALQLANRDVTMGILEKNGHLLGDAHESFKDDKKVVMKALANYSPAIKYVSERLRDDPEVILEAATGYFENQSFVQIEVLPYASERLQGKVKPRDSEEREDLGTFLENLVKLNGMELGHIGKEIMATGYGRIIINAALAKDGMAIQFIDPNNKRYADYASRAAKQNPKAIAFISDREALREILRFSGIPMEFVQDQFKNDEELLKIALEKDPWVLRHLTEKVKSNVGLVEFAMSHSHNDALQYANKDAVLGIVSKNGLMLQHAGFYQHDKEVVEAALQNNPAASQWDNRG
jgi:uncharacterized protein YoxC